MTTTLRDGQSRWRMRRTDDGHRHYQLTHKIYGSVLDGPANVLQTPGLPLPGSFWAFDDDLDVYAYCTQEATVEPLVEGKNTEWEVTQVFTTEPKLRCSEEQFEDPLFEPQKLSGSFIRGRKEATRDRFDNPIVTSAHEPIRGPQVEFDESLPTVVVEQNVLSLEFELLCSMIDKVNDRTLWNFGARQIKLSSITWQENWYGTCFKYYTRRFEFEMNVNTFDRDILDEGTKVLHGHWGPTGNWVLDNINGSPPDPDNPQHFDRAKDRKEENIRMVLNGAGLPADVPYGTGSGSSPGGPGNIHVEYYGEVDFLLLGIPTEIED